MIGSSKHSAKQRRIKYGMLEGDFEEWWNAQSGRCAICEDDLEHGKGGLAVDHDHVTGDVRGLLCTRCNVGIGMFRDDVQLLSQAITYLCRRSS